MGTGSPFQTIQVSGQVTDQIVNRIQANISAALGSSSGNPVTSVSQKSYAVQITDTILVFDTTQIAGVNSSSPLIIALPDATKNNGFSFDFMKIDTTSNPVNFITTAKNKQGQNQTIQKAAAPFQVTASLAHGSVFSDGNNWWVK
jgi:hypothetical protein